MKEAQLHTVYLGLGSNMGNQREMLDAACEEIGKLIGTIVRQSAFHVTAPWGFSSANDFLNAVVCVSTRLSPRRLLRTTQRIERMLGKRKEHATERTTDKNATGRTTADVYHDRPIDIDILLYDDITVDEPDLKIPHPLMQERDFVMIPLREVLPNITSPESSPSSRQSS